MKTLYVGNLPFNSSEQEITKAFSIHGKVHKVKLIRDRLTGKPRGFGFVEMDDAAAETALAAMNSTRFKGHRLRVDRAAESLSRSHA